MSTRLWGHNVVSVSAWRWCFWSAIDQLARKHLEKQPRSGCQASGGVCLREERDANRQKCGKWAALSPNPALSTYMCTYTRVCRANHVLNIQANLIMRLYKVCCAKQQRCRQSKTLGAVRIFQNYFLIKRRRSRRRWRRWPRRSVISISILPNAYGSFSPFYTCRNQCANTL